MFNKAESYYASEVSRGTAPLAKEQVDLEFLCNVESGPLWSQKITPREDDVEVNLEVNPPDESPMNHPPAEADEEPKAKECENVVEEEHDPESPNEIPEAATP